MGIYNLIIKITVNFDFVHFNSVSIGIKWIKLTANIYYFGLFRNLFYSREQ